MSRTITFVLGLGAMLFAVITFIMYLLDGVLLLSVSLVATFICGIVAIGLTLRKDIWQ